MPPEWRVRGTSGRTYVLRLTTNTICRVEALCAQSYAEIVAAFRQTPRLSLVRAFVQGTVVSQEAVTAQQAGEMLDDIGGAGPILQGFRGGR